MLRFVPDREAAKEAARVNLSALAVGQERIVIPERHWSAGQVKEAIVRGGEDLGLIRAAIWRLVERCAPAVDRLPRGRNLGPER